VMRDYWRDSAIITCSHVLNLCRILSLEMHHLNRHFPV
jgi:hypothetical protein